MANYDVFIPRSPLVEWNTSSVSGGPASEGVLIQNVSAIDAGTAGNLVATNLFNGADSSSYQVYPSLQDTVVSSPTTAT